MWFTLSDDKPIYRQLREHIESLILTGELDGDQALPSVRSISLDLKVNPQTILKTIQDLASRGIIYKKRGMGMFVASDARKRLIDEKKEAYMGSELPRCLRRGLAMGVKKEKLQEVITRLLREAEP